MQSKEAVMDDSHYFLIFYTLHNCSIIQDNEQNNSEIQPYVSFFQPALMLSVLT